MILVFNIAIRSLSIELSWLVDSEGILCLRIWLPPAHLFTTQGGGFTLSLQLLNVRQGSCEYQFLQFVSFIRPGIKPLVTVSVANAPYTRSSIG